MTGGWVRGTNDECGLVWGTKGETEIVPMFFVVAFVVCEFTVEEGPLRASLFSFLRLPRKDLVLNANLQEQC